MSIHTIKQFTVYRHRLILNGQAAAERDAFTVEVQAGPYMLVVRDFQDMESALKAMKYRISQYPDRLKLASVLSILVINVTDGQRRGNYAFVEYDDRRSPIFDPADIFGAVTRIIELRESLDASNLVENASKLEEIRLRGKDLINTLGLKDVLTVLPSQREAQRELESRKQISDFRKLMGNLFNAHARYVNACKIGVIKTMQAETLADMKESRRLDVGIAALEVLKALGIRNICTVQPAYARGPGSAEPSNYQKQSEASVKMAAAMVSGFDEFVTIDPKSWADLEVRLIANTAAAVLRDKETTVPQTPDVNGFVLVSRVGHMKVIVSPGGSDVSGYAQTLEDLNTRLTALKAEYNGITLLADVGDRREVLREEITKTQALIDILK